MAFTNIVIQKTKDKFGYLPEKLKPSSEKLVIWKCDICFTEKDKKYRYAIKNNLCLKCSNKKNANSNLELRAKKTSDWIKKNGHPLLGTKRPHHVLIELKKGREIFQKLVKTETWRKKMSLSSMGEKNHFFGKKHTLESLEKMKAFQKTNSATRGKRSNFYGQKPKHGRGAWYSCKDGSKIWLRSSWEIKYAKYLDNLNIEWLYEIKTFPITYDNKEGTYTPDFFLIKENKFIEIKGWWRDDAFIKYTSFRKQYPSLIVELYEKSQLIELGIDLKSMPH